MQIGHLKIKGSLFLAPMSNVTSLPFRLMCKRYGAAMLYSEMINADAYIRESPRTEKRAFFLEKERPVGLQLFGSGADILKKAAKKAEQELKPDLIDINVGCPAHNVMKLGGGASLLKDEIFLGNLVKSLSESISVPLTCKMRITNNDEKTVKIARILEQSGAKAITVHGRTAKQRYSGKANWDVIKEIKKEIGIPVILNGDIKDEISAEKAFDYTKCDAIMIGRAAIGNPFIFKKINHYLITKKILEKQTLKEKIADFVDFVGLCKKYEYLNISAIKTQAQNFMKGFEGSRKIRENISDSKTIGELLILIKKISIL